MRNGELSSRHGLLVVAFLFLFWATLMTSIPAVYTRAIAQESETTVVAIVEPTMREFSERQWDFASSESRASFNLLQTDTEAQPV
ncbi:MAG: hypothetical protein PVJ05_05115, partial [Candidatus Thorarchaeota archaeon]